MEMPELPQDVSLNKYSLEFSFKELQHATENFADSNRLGKGAFGAVYKGVRADGTEIAIKVLEIPEEGGFEDEVRVLSKFRHPNLVILIGFARRNVQRLLVYELLEGGDLFKRLHRSTHEGLPFPWRSRIGVAYNAACGLSHLHNSTPKAFHRDIKSANILLDSNGTAKMADFGLSCLSNTRARHVAQAGGTPGYACPHYARTSIVTEGSEVYSFGVVLLELISACAPAWVSAPPHGIKEYKFLTTVIHGEASVAMSLADPKANWPSHVLPVVVELALQCSNSVEEKRPLFAEVVSKLRKMRDLPDQAPSSSFPGVANSGAAANPAVHLAVSRAGQGIVQLPPPVAHAALPPFAPAARIVHQVLEEDHCRPVHATGDLLWALECTYVEGRSANDIPYDSRSIVHYQELGLSSPPLLKIGRRFQEHFFASLILRDEVRNMVSREHFKIWAVECSEARGSGVVRVGVSEYQFFLQNLSGNYTSVNGLLLDGVDKNTRIVEGDSIGLGVIVTESDGSNHYTPFMTLTFSLAGSKLCRRPRSVSMQLQGPDNKSASSARRGSQEADMSPLPDIADKWCTLSDEIIPQFVLEIRGTAIQDHVPPDSLRIVHGPTVGKNYTQFEPLTVGRGHDTDFWSDLLREEAFQSLSRDHLIFEPLAVTGVSVRDLLRHGQRLAPTGVTVRNLSGLRPIRVKSNVDASANLEAELLRDAEKLSGAEKRHLQHGDLIVLQSTKGCSLWFSFRDLRVAPEEAYLDSGILAGGA